MHEKATVWTIESFSYLDLGDGEGLEFGDVCM